MIKITKEMPEWEAAYVYFSIISLTNKLQLREKEINLLSSIAVSDLFDRDKWIEENRSSINSFYNMKYRLKRKSLLIEGKINPILKVDFKHINIFIYINDRTK